MAKVKYKAPTAGMNRMIKNLDAESRPSISMTEVKGEIYYLSPDLIVPYKNQARKGFDDESLNELALSIKSQGIIQPLQVIKSDSILGKFEVVSGERRLRAAQIIGLETVPCMILDKNRDANEIALIENIQREDLHPIEFAEAVSLALQGQNYGSQTALADRLGVSRAKIAHLMAISRLPQDVKNHFLKCKDIKIGQLKSLAYLSGEDKIREKVFSLKNNVKQFTSILRISTNGELVKLEQNKINGLSVQEKKLLREQLMQLIEAI